MAMIYMCDCCGKKISPHMYRIVIQGFEIRRRKPRKLIRGHMCGPCLEDLETQFYSFRPTKEEVTSNEHN